MFYIIINIYDIYLFASIIDQNSINLITRLQLNNDIVPNQEDIDKLTSLINTFMDKYITPENKNVIFGTVIKPILEIISKKTLDELMGLNPDTLIIKMFVILTELLSNEEVDGRYTKQIFSSMNKILNNNLTTKILDDWQNINPNQFIEKISDQFVMAILLNTYEEDKFKLIEPILTKLSTTTLDDLDVNNNNTIEFYLMKSLFQHILNDKLSILDPQYRDKMIHILVPPILDTVQKITENNNFFTILENRRKDGKTNNRLRLHQILHLLNNSMTDSRYSQEIFDKFIKPILKELKMTIKDNSKDLDWFFVYANRSIVIDDLQLLLDNNNIAPIYREKVCDVLNAVLFNNNNKNTHMHS